MPLSEAEELELLELEVEVAEKSKNSAPAKKPSLSPFESGVSGLAQGLTMGFADEIGGAGRAAVDKLTGSDEPFAELYRKYQKEQQAHTNKASADNPKTYMGAELGGDVATSLAAPVLNPVRGAKIGANVGKMALTGAAYGAGKSSGNLDDNKGKTDLLIDSLIGGSIGGVTQGAMQGVGNAARALSPSSLRKFAEKAAVNATGATGKQSQTFSPEAGRKLLDEKIVTFGSRPEGIAKNAEASLQRSYQNLDPLLQKLDDQGASIPKEEIVASLKKKVAELQGLPSQGDVVDQLEKQIARIDMGMDNYPLRVAEGEKRAYQDQVNYLTDKVTHDAKKGVASAYQKAVEGKANQLDPALGSLFKKAKENYSVIEPIREAAEKRAATTNQSPWGGLLDTAAVATGLGAGYAGADGDPLSSLGAGAAGLVGRRVLAPRAASAAAVSSDKLANLLSKAPQNLKSFSESLYKAVEAGMLPRAVAERMIEQAVQGDK